MNKENLITVNDLISQLELHMTWDSKMDIWEYGLKKGWLERGDIADKDNTIERRQAARILHEFLKRELKEEDTADWDRAKSLLDLYDCRICVNHVAQVYCKGIMGGISEHVFGMKEGVLREELEPIVESLFARKVN